MARALCCRSCGMRTQPWSACSAAWRSSAAVTAWRGAAVCHGSADIAEPLKVHQLRLSSISLLQGQWICQVTLLARKGCVRASTRRRSVKAPPLQDRQGMQCEAAPRLRLHAQRPAAIQSRSQRGGGRADELQLRLLTSDVAPGARLGLLLLLAQLPSGGRGEGDGPRAPPGAPAGAPARDAQSAPARHGGLGLGSFLSSMTGARSQAGQAAPAAAPPTAGPAAAAPAANGRARSRLADAGPRTDCEARDASPSPGSIWASVWARKPLVGKRCRAANRWSPITERRQRAWRGQSAQHQRCPAASPQRRGVVSHGAGHAGAAAAGGAAGPRGVSMRPNPTPSPARAHPGAARR